jgi:hypothetical protein
MSRTPRKELTEQQLTAARALAAGATLAQAAEESDSSVRAITNWKRNPLFIAELSSQTQKLVHENLPAVLAMVYEKAKVGVPWACQLVVKHAEYIAALESKIPDTEVAVGWADEPILPAQVTEEEDSPVKDAPVVHTSSGDMPN